MTSRRPLRGSSGRVLRTPLRQSRGLSEIAGGEVFLKLESLQPTFSYKIRGATNAVLKLVESGDSRPIVTASAGNHGYAMAHASAAAARSLTVYISEDAPRTKVDAIRKAGAELRPCADYDEAERRAREHAANGDAVYISPYAHPDVIAGAGTVGLEIVEDLPSVELIVAAVGGGGLISGIALAAPARRRRRCRERRVHAFHSLARCGTDRHDRGGPDDCGRPHRQPGSRHTHVRPRSSACRVDRRCRGGGDA